MPILTRSRIPTMADASPGHDAAESYRSLALAVVKQALQDATGTVFAPGPVAPDQIQAEAVAWLQDEAAVADLLELCGYDADPVVHRVRQMLPRVPARHQLPLFAERTPLWPPVPSAD